MRTALAVINPNQLHEDLVVPPVLLNRVVGELPPLEIDEVAQLRRERLAAPRRG